MLSAQSLKPSWVRTFGGSISEFDPDFNERVLSMALDSLDNSYLYGTFYGNIDFDPSEELAIHSSNVSLSSYIAKYDSEGNFIWVKVLDKIIPSESPLHSNPRIILDSDGNILITGDFNGQRDFDPSADSTFLTSSSYSNRNIFFAKYTSNGDFLWAKNITTNNYFYCGGITTDSSGSVFITGFFDGTSDFDPSSGIANQYTVSGGRDMYLAKYDSDGNYNWAHRIGGIYGIEGWAICTDSQNDIILTGTFYSTADFDPNEDQFVSATAPTSHSQYIAKYDVYGNCKRVAVLNGYYSWNRVNKIVSDKSGNIYITGMMESSIDLDPSSDTAFFTSDTYGDVFVAKYDSLLNYQWGKVHGGPYYDRGNSIAIDDLGNVLIAGIFPYTLFIHEPSDTLVLVSAGSLDNYIIKYNSNGEIIFYDSFGGPGLDYANDIALTKDGQVLICGSYFNHTDFSPGSDTLFVNTVSFMDGYLVKLSECFSRIDVSFNACRSFLSPSGKFFTESAVFKDTISNTQGCDSIMTFNLIVNNPHVSIIENDTYLEASISNVIYQWVDCNNNFEVLVGENLSQFYPDENGYYSVIIIENDCTDTSECIHFDRVSIHQIDSKDSFFISPNPFNSSFQVEVQSTNSNLFYRITDLTGRLILTNPLSSNVPLFIGDSLPSGSFLISIYGDDKLVYSKLIVKY